MVATIRKGDLAMRVADRLKVPRATGDAVLNAVLSSITEAVAGGNRVVLTGFGSFETRQVKERQVTAIRGPKAGQRITVPAHARIGFTVGADLAKAAHTDHK